jgi:hypothetical protein
MEGITGVLFRGRINGSGTVVRARRSNGCRHAVCCNLLDLAMDLATLRKPAIRHQCRRSLPSATPRGARTPGAPCRPSANRRNATLLPRPSHISGAAPESRPGLSPHARRALLRDAQYAPEYQPGPARVLAPAGRRETFSLTIMAHRGQIREEHTREVAL